MRENAHARRAVANNEQREEGEKKDGLDRHKTKKRKTHAKPRVARAICVAPLNFEAGEAVSTHPEMTLPASAHS